MSENTSSHIELLKGPVLILSIVVSVVLLDLFSIVNFENLTKISATGIEFQETS